MLNHAATPSVFRKSTTTGTIRTRGPRARGRLPFVGLLRHYSSAITVNAQCLCMTSAKIDHVHGMRRDRSRAESRAWVVKKN